MIRAAGIFAVAAAVTSVLFINFCATVFQCGCQWIWGLADTYCNIHNAHSRHCPWCSFGMKGYTAVFGGILAAQLGVTIATGIAGWRWWLRLAAAVAAFPAVGLVFALVLGWYTGYWN